MDGEPTGAQIADALEAALRTNATDCILMKERFDTLAIYVSRDRSLSQERRLALAEVVRDLGACIVAEMRVGGARE